jgi:nucleoside-diphosphate-sugar epimerase
VVDLVHVFDVARLLVDALAAPYGSVIEAGTGTGTTVLRAAQDVLAATESKSEIVHVPTPAGFVEGIRLVSPVVNPDFVRWADGLAATVPFYAWAMAS